jgi:hypothetical protein
MLGVGVMFLILMHNAAYGEKKNMDKGLTIIQNKNTMHAN